MGSHNNRYVYLYLKVSHQVKITGAHTNFKKEFTILVHGTKFAIEYLKFRPDLISLVLTGVRIYTVQQMVRERQS